MPVKTVEDKAKQNVRILASQMDDATDVIRKARKAFLDGKYSEAAGLLSQAHSDIDFLASEVEQVEMSNAK